MSNFMHTVKICKVRTHVYVLSVLTPFRRPTWIMDDDGMFFSPCFTMKLQQSKQWANFWVSPWRSKMLKLVWNAIQC